LTVCGGVSIVESPPNCWYNKYSNLFVTKLIIVRHIGEEVRK